MAVESIDPGLWTRFKSGAREQVTGSPGDVIFRLIALGFTLIILALAVMMVYNVWNGAQQSIDTFGFFAFMRTEQWDPVFREFGALHVIVGTLASSLIAVVLAVPIALGISLFITELAPPVLRSPVAFIIDILAAIPSIVYGLWGIYVLIPFLMNNIYEPVLLGYFDWLPIFSRPSFGFSLLTAGIILAIMIVPIISAISREIIAAVPAAQKEGMLALGATRWEVMWKVILPYARAGIVGAIILGLARAIGETMAVTMVIGNANFISANVLGPSATMASIIANEFREATTSIHVSALIHVGLVLMIISLIVNVMARLLVWSVASGPAGEERR
jgi:phosphate transport system permease protein